MNDPARRGEILGESVLVVGTFPPTECGIATYTSNLREGLAACGLDSGVLRVLDAAEADEAEADVVVGRWLREDPTGAEASARVADRFDAVLLQHEFGIFPGPDGADVIRFLTSCNRPVLTVLHTVLDSPTPSQREIVDAIVRESELVIVHSDVARGRLLEVYDVAPERVAIVPHGATPNLCGPATLTSVEPILLTWGLIGPGKGIERGIRALEQMRSAGLDVRYVVAGQTHPNVRRRDGEQYRESLSDLAHVLGVADLVEFRGCYADWDELRAIVRSAAVVLLPYDTRDQVTSGVLVEALAAGKPVVATAFPHATELSHTGAVVVVDHDDAQGVGSAVSSILSNPVMKARMESAARGESARYDWPTVGGRFRRLIDVELRDASLRHPLAG